MANTPAASPTVSSTVGLKNMVIAPLTVDTEETLTYTRAILSDRLSL